MNLYRVSLLAASFRLGMSSSEEPITDSLSVQFVEPRIAFPVHFVPAPLAKVVGAKATRPSRDADDSDPAEGPHYSELCTFQGIAQRPQSSPPPGTPELGTVSDSDDQHETIDDKESFSNSSSSEDGLL